MRRVGSIRFSVGCMDDTDTRLPGLVCIPLCLGLVNIMLRRDARIADRIYCRGSPSTSEPRARRSREGLRHP